MARTIPNRTSGSIPLKYRAMMRDRFPWARWEDVVRTRGWVLDRPADTAHPEHPEIIYPMDYGYIPGTTASDGDAVDCFVGTASEADPWLVGLILTTDHRKGDREAKLLIRCTPQDVYTAHGFINYDRTLLEGLLILRHPMRTLWDRERKS